MDERPHGEPKAWGPSWDGEARCVSGRYTTLVAQPQCPLHSPGSVPKISCPPEPPHRLPISPTEHPRREETDDKGLWAPVLSPCTSALPLAFLGCQPGRATLRQLTCVIWTGSTGPLGFLSPACQDQEGSKQQLTSLPRVQPRAGGPSRRQSGPSGMEMGSATHLEEQGVGEMVSGRSNPQGLPGGGCPRTGLQRMCRI